MRFVALVLLLHEAGGAVAVTCEERSGPPGAESVASVTIDSPLPGSLVSASAPCDQGVSVWGRYAISAAAASIDLYVVIDGSASTGDPSGVDVDGDGVEDSIYLAEVTAAQLLVRALDPALYRVAVISFDHLARVEQHLTSDLARADFTLDRMKRTTPTNGTRYVPALEQVLDEVARRGDPATRVQRASFLSDGRPLESTATIAAKAGEVALAGVTIDTFGLGVVSSDPLREMARVTGGAHVSLPTPSAILDALPDSAPAVAHSVAVRNATAGTPGTVTVDEAARTYAATVAIVPGPNLLIVTLSVASAPPLVVECNSVIALDSALHADAGPAVAGCAGDRVTLDGAASVVRPCAEPSFRWIKPDGRVACAGPTPTCEVTLEPGLTHLRLEVGCLGTGCLAVDTATVTVQPPPAMAPSVVTTCATTAVLACGGVPELAVGWDLDLDVDSDLDGDPGNDVDLAGCDAVALLREPDGQVVRCRSFDEGTGCGAQADLLVVATPPLPRPLTAGLCPWEPTVLSCGTPQPGTTYTWDLDGVTDADRNGNPRDDADDFGCEVSVSWPDGLVRQVTCWSDDGTDCPRVVAEGSLSVSANAVPGRVTDLLVLRPGGGLHLDWTAATAAVVAHVTRGTLEALHRDRFVAHAADPDAGRGGCAVPAGGAFVIVADAADGEDYFYLVVSRSACGGESDGGWGFDGHARVPRAPREATPACP